MLGQQKLLHDLKVMKLNRFPRFVILVGDKGSGKKMLVKQIATTLSADLVTPGNKVDDVREVLELTSKRTETAVYLFADADKMSASAKNALLKITEEPPKNAYFVMTVETIVSLPQTLISRSTMLVLSPYGAPELLQYATQKGHNFDASDSSWLTVVVMTPGQVDELLASCDIKEMQEFAATVVDNVALVNGANAFKIGSRLKLKDGATGYDPLFFFRAVAAEFGIRFLECCKRGDAQQADRIKLCIRETVKYESQLRIVDINKSSTLDMWILAIRGILIE